MFTTYVKDDMFLGKTFYSLFFIPNQSNYILVYLMQSQNAIIYFDSMFCDEFIRGGSRTAALSNIERFVIKALHLGCCNSPKSALFVMMIFFFFFFWMVDRRKALSLISSRDYSGRFSPLQASDTRREGYKHVQNLSLTLLNDVMQY